MNQEINTTSNKNLSRSIFEEIFMEKEEDICLQSLYKLYEQKKKVNHRYSLRALARDLDIEQSNLSKIMNGKRKLNTSHVLRIAKALNLTSEETITLLDAADKTRS